MADTDQDIKIAEQIAATRTELDAAREVVRTLANDLADVADVIEPILADHIKRIRQARMGSLDELSPVGLQCSDEGESRRDESIPLTGAPVPL